MIEKPTITIVHQLPGRVRLSLSHGLKDPELTASRVSKHPGISSVVYTPISRSVLVIFDPFEITQPEIIVRLACCLSSDHGGASIRVLAAPEAKELSDSAFYSALSLLVALATRAVRSAAGTPRPVDWAAGFMVAGAVLLHGWHEIRRQGYFDPEVLSVVYLAGALARRQVLLGAAVTWITTFGRHLIKPPMRGIELRMMQPAGKKEPSEDGCEIIATPDRTAATTTRMLRFVPELVRHALIGGGGPANGGLLGQMTTLARLHDSVLEGLGEAKYGIPIKVRNM